LSIEEQVATIITNGLAVATADRPQVNVVSTFAAFFEGIAREGFEMWRYQRNLNGVNEGLNVIFHMSHVGAITGRDHFSGWSLDWITLGLGYLPYVDRFYTPADARGAFVAIRDAAERYGAHIVAIPRDNVPVLGAADGSAIYDPADAWTPVSELSTVAGAKTAVLALGATAFIAEEAAKTLNAAGIATDVHVINGFPIEEADLAALLGKYAGIVTVEDGLIATRAQGLRGFAGLVAGAAYGSALKLEHIGISDPRVAPADGHMEVWEHFGITSAAIVAAAKKVQ
jgi:transketolase C-terminal domain/subunit